jgi:ABC-type Fe3+ transport system substrate-binding protein
VALKNVGVEFGSIVAGVTYNTSLVRSTDAPKTLQDVLNPRWRGQIASTQNAAIFDRLVARPEWGADRVKDYVARLSPLVGGLIRCGEVPRVISGEFSLLVLDCGSLFVRLAQAEGAPLAHVIPEDASTMAFLHFGVPRNSARPNLAKLFVNAVMSEEGQRLVYELYSTDHPDLPGSQSAVELVDLKAKGIVPLRVDVRFVAEHPDSGQITEDLVRILRSGS